MALALIQAKLQIQRRGVGDFGALNDFGFGLEEVFAGGARDEGGIGGGFGFEFVARDTKHKFLEIGNFRPFE